MTNDQLGRAPTDNLRDAVHVAIMPAIAGATLQPGQHVGYPKTGRLVEALTAGNIGVVDPFLTKPVEQGERFWMLLYPNTITSLRHEWTHPFISDDGVGVMSESEKWLRDFANKVDADYFEMMAVAATHCDDKRSWGDYLCEGGKWEGQGTPNEFWTHYEAVTGKKPADTKYGNPEIFSCSC